MARIRSIKPEFWTSAQILECSTNARLLFVGLWNFCDDLGRHPMVAKQVKAEVFPADSFTEAIITAMLTELVSNGLITLYDHDNKRYFYVSGWKHQRIDKPQPAKYPDPFGERSKIIPRTFPPDRIGEDRKGRELREVYRSTTSKFAWPSNYREVFWAAYPRKAGKRAALKALDKIHGTIEWQSIIGGVARLAASNLDPKFTKHPATWLNAGCWDDEQLPPEHHNGKTASPILATLDRGLDAIRQDRIRNGENTGNAGIFSEGGGKRPNPLPARNSGNPEPLPELGD